MSSYQLYVDGLLIGQFGSLDEAMATGVTQSKSDNAVHIESLNAPAPSLGWRYDREVKDWVSTSLPIDDEES